MDSDALPGIQITLDDAFDDGGEDEHDAAHFQFSSDTIRNELARQNGLSWQDDEENVVEDVPLERETHDPDDSVSTIDINASEPFDASPTSISLPHSPEPRSSSATSSANGGDRRDSFQQDHNDYSPSHSHYPSVIINVPSKVVTSPTFEEFPSSANAKASSSPDPTLSHADGASSPPPIPGLLDRSTDNGRTHRISRSAGPSALEQVISKTRPPYLPPKAKREDIRHLADWEEMMKQSRVIEQQKQQAKEERRLARERAVEQSTHLWEKSIIPDWKSAAKDTNLRSIWWNGVPPKLRGVVWEKAIGNSLALSKGNTYKFCLGRAQRALSSGSFPSTTTDLIEEDIRTTFPTLHIFNSLSGPLYQDLKDLLCAWVVARSDEGLGYVVGASKVAAMLLLNMPPSPAFIAMRNLLERHCLRSFYGGLSCRDDVEAYYRIFDTLLADRMPKVYFNFKQHQVSPAAYLPEWIISIFVDHLPLEACARIYDVLVLEGDSFLFRAALGILASLESRLFFPDRKELLDLLAGKNMAALEVARREGSLLGACKYEIYALDEETVWKQIAALNNEWWKESTWTRLIQRELPDL